MNKNNRQFTTLLTLTFIVQTVLVSLVIAREPITLESLLAEMVTVEAVASMPEPYYTTRQLTSYDRRSVIPGTPSWHANDDWSGFVRYEANNGRVEKVLFDTEGPGVITRIITTGGAQGTNLRIYLDDDKEAAIFIPGFDISKFPVEIPEGLLYRHEKYPEYQGSSFYLPIPYQKRCRITIDNLERACVYHVNYRTYEPEVKVQTFTLSEAAALKNKIAEVNAKLLEPKMYLQGQIVKSDKLMPGTKLSLDLPTGPSAVRTLNFKVSGYDKAQYQQLMRGLIVRMSFDGTQTVCAPLSDLSGAGVGAAKVDSWYLAADGSGVVVIRFVMPYKQSASIELENLTRFNTDAEVEAYISDWQWSADTLYFHATWRQELNLLTNHGNDYNMATLSGRGVFVGDTLSLYNHTSSWYGEGDEHIWIDDEEFPSDFGVGTEDYYNTTYAPINVFHTPFGGAPRADNKDSQGYNTFLRTRNLDIIAFKHKLQFDFELVSWATGHVDYASTIYWYGDLDSKAINQSEEAQVLHPLDLQQAYTASKCLFKNSDFELGDLTNWSAQGDAFDYAQPTKGDNTSVRGRQSCQQQGQFWIGSYENHDGKTGMPGDIRGDEAIGRLKSVEFTIEKPFISLRVGGGCDAEQIYVALVVDGKEVLRETGNTTETMEFRVWDVSLWQGQKACIIINDNAKGSWGVINADDFRYVSENW